MYSLFFTSCFISAAWAVTKVPPSVTATTFYGASTDTAFNPTIGRDGGGGGYVNGQHFIVFADSFTFNPSGSYSSFVHNTVAYQTNSSDPHILYDFGDFTKPAGNRTFTGNVWSAVTASEKQLGVNFAVWPNSNMVPYNSTHAVGYFDCANLTDGSTPIYSTIALLNVSSPLPSTGQTILSGSRPVPVMYNYTSPDDPVNYGQGGILKDTLDGYLYLFGPAKSTGGMRVARVTFGSIFDKTQYTYWNGTAWTNTAPAADASAADLFRSPSYWPDRGNIFYSSYFQTLVSIFTPDLGVSFYITYATNNDIKGTWSTPALLYQTPTGFNGKSGSCSTGYGIYSGHSYPEWDPTGKTMLLSWTPCNRLVEMAQVTFA